MGEITAAWRPYETLIRHHPESGIILGAHHEERYLVVQDGVVISSDRSRAIELRLGSDGNPSLPLFSDVLGSTLALSLAQLADREEEAKDLKENMMAMAERLADAEAKVAEQAQQIVALLASAEPPPLENTEPTIVPFVPETKIEAQAAEEAAKNG